MPISSKVKFGRGPRVSLVLPGFAFMVKFDRGVQGPPGPACVLNL